MSSRVFSCKFEVVIETKSTESLGASVDVSGQLLGIVLFSVRIKDKWTMGSFLLLGGSIEKYLNIENLIKIRHHTQQKPIMYSIINVIKAGRHVIDDRLGSIFNCFQALCHLKKLLPDDLFQIRNNFRSIIAQCF
jgi:hypothetical protein